MKVNQYITKLLLIFIVNKNLHQNKIKKKFKRKIKAIFQLSGEKIDEFQKTQPVNSEPSRRTYLVTYNQAGLKKIPQEKDLENP